MDELKQLCRRLPQALRAALHALECKDAANLEEIRLYADAGVELVIEGQARRLDVPVDMQELLAALSGHALYSCERQMTEGYIPLEGGHRAGVCGRMVCQPDGSWRMTQVSSVCIRIGRVIADASMPVRPFLLDDHGKAQRVLVLGAPGSGKTTLLRDAALWLAHKGLHIAVADEREELFAEGTAGMCLDVLSGMDKAHAFPMLLRSMAPQVIISDEIGRDEDVQAVLDIVRCGMGLLVSAHARSMQEAALRPAIQAMMGVRAFDWYILLGWRAQVMGVYDCTGKKWEGTERGQLGYGGDGDDCDQRDGVSAFGWRETPGILDARHAPLSAAHEQRDPL